MKLDGAILTEDSDVQEQNEEGQDAAGSAVLPGFALVPGLQRLDGNGVHETDQTKLDEKAR